MLSLLAAGLFQLVETVNISLSRSGSEVTVSKIAKCQM
jgi:hypothetical protein